ncbi:MAG: SulP family inorganic anion transporter [Pseudomonadota bacterium]|uniref:SulP family inorganic anion transporter n=1 Tax=Polaromonas sp. TaxID=1869339 RepID=UPI00182A99A8|nr:SulP family inorganic anion transporter [Polaromonas sp.]MBA3594382.1 SulP family inorganic anion transporter [Polaromonas sp.]MDQ3272969.1 SulP family inorganic anion transporter [Pseudomonadota bacterium]
MQASQDTTPSARAPAVFERLFGGWVHTVTPETLRHDLMAALLGAVLVLPQGIAFATLAGLPPEYGLYTAIVPCIVAALFGSSWHVMSGPTNANSLALFAMVSPLALAFSPGYIQMALAVTVLVGIMQWLIGALRLGSLANFISPAALFGFTSGAALLIAVYALPDLLGLAPAAEHGAAAVLIHVLRQLGALQPAALAVAGVTIAIALLVRRLRPSWPSMLAGLVAATLLGWGWATYVSTAPLPLRTVGQIQTPWPQFAVPTVSWSALSELLGLAFALTIVALGQSISIAKAVAARSGQRIDANREFRGQGLSNIVGGFFSSYVSCGSLNRSMPNLEAGARTPLAAVFSAVLLLVLVALSAKLLAQIPMAALAALLLLVAVSLLDIKRWKQLWALSRTEFGVAFATMVATVSIRLEVAILLGTLLSLMSFLYRTSKPAMRTMGFDSRVPDRQFVVLADAENPLQECPQLKLLRMEGEVYFGATQHVADTLHALRHAPQPQKHLLVMGKSMNFIDLAGAQLWEQELVARRVMGGDLYFHRPRPEVIQMWQTTGFTRLLGPAHQFPDKRSAIATIFTRLDPAICRQCTVRIFEECRSVPGPDAVTPRPAA